MRPSSSIGTAAGPAQQIRVDVVAIHREASQAAALSPHDDIRASLNRLHQVQDHSPR